MRYAAWIVLIAAGCAQTSVSTDVALEAYGRGDLDRAQALLGDSRDPHSLRLRARIHLLRNRNAEAAALLAAIPPRERDAGDYSYIAIAYLRQDDFVGASKAYALLGEALLARKYEALARNVGYLVEPGWQEARVDFLSADPLPVVSVRVNGRPATLIIDTCLDELVLDRDFAKGARVKAAILDTVELGRLTVRNVPVRLDALPKLKADGAIGLGFLMHYDFTIDYRRGRLTLRPPGAKIDGVQALIAGDRYLLAPAKVNGSSGVFACLNTGLAGTAVASALSDEVRDVEVGALRLVRPTADARAFPSGLQVSFGLPVGLVLGHDAFKGRSLRLEPRSMKLAIE